jgi:hypothetical protein
VRLDEPKLEIFAKACTRARQASGRSSDWMSGGPPEADSKSVKVIFAFDVDFPRYQVV